MKKNIQNVLIKRPKRQILDLRRRSNIVVEIADNDSLLFPENVRRVTILNDEIEKARVEAHRVAKQDKRKSKRRLGNIHIARTKKQLISG